MSLAASTTNYRVTTLQTLWNSLTICGTPGHFNWYPYHACTTSAKVNDQTVKFIFNDNDFIMTTKSLLTQLRQFLGTFPWQDFSPDNSLTFPWLLVKFLTFPWHLYNSLAFPDFPDEWSPWNCCMIFIRERLQYAAQHRKRYLCTWCIDSAAGQTAVQVTPSFTAEPLLYDASRQSLEYFFTFWPAVTAAAGSSIAACRWVANTSTRQRGIFRTTLWSQEINAFSSTSTTSIIHGTVSLVINCFWVCTILNSSNIINNYRWLLLILPGSTTTIKKAKG